jgi:hypothetical protein
MRAFTALLFALAFATAAHAEEPISDAFLAYAAFQQDISALDNAPMESPVLMNAALERAARHERIALARGFIAYGALTAAQSPAFVAGVESRVRAAGRAAVIRQLSSDVTYARRRPPGAAEAVGLILNMAAYDRARLDRIATYYDGVGRQVQSAGWPPTSNAARDARTLRLSTLAATTPAPEGLALNLASAGSETDPARRIGGRHFWDDRNTSYHDTPLPEPREARRDSLDRMLTLGALFIVGASDEAADRANALMRDENTSACLNMAQLHFRQCVSVAYGADEDALCLARHGLRDVGACFGNLAQ